MFLYMLAFMLTSVVEQAFFLEKACLVNHGHPANICQTIDTNDTLKKEVQVILSLIAFLYFFLNSASFLGDRFEFPSMEQYCRPCGTHHFGPILGLVVG